MLNPDKYYREQIAEKIADYLVSTLKTKGKGHRASVTDLPLSLLQLVCGRVRQTAPQVETYILAAVPRTSFEINATKLIELRNVSNKIVLALIPLDLRSDAEDSYGEHTFETLSVKPALYELRTSLLAQTSITFPSIKRIINTPHVRRQSIENVIRYLLAVRADLHDSQAPGKFLPLLNLIPDLGITDGQVETRIDLNSKKVEILAYPERPLLAKIESLKLKPDTIQGDLFRYLREGEGTDLQIWLPRTIEWGLTFERWQDAEAHTPDQPITVTLDPLEDFKGLEREDEDYVAFVGTPITPSWKISPPSPDHVSHLILSLVRFEREEEDLFPPKRVSANKRKVKLDLKNVEVDEDEGRVPARIEIRVFSSEDVELASDQSDAFWVERTRDGTIPSEGEDEVEQRRDPNGKQVRSVAEGQLLAALTARSKSARKVDLDIRAERSGWVNSSKAKGAVPDIYRLRLGSSDVFHLKFVPLLRDLETSILNNPKALLTFRLTLSTVRSSTLPQPQMEEIQHPASQSASFLKARRDIFEAVVTSTPGALIELADLKPHDNLILRYAEAFCDLLANDPANPALVAIDSLHLITPDGQVLLLAPTHPLRLLWLLQYQRLLAQWTQSILETKPDRVSHLINRTVLEQITSRNAPPFLGTAPGQVWINTDNIDLYWSIYSPAPVERSREILSSVYRTLRIANSQADASTIRADQIADHVSLYLKQHPYIRTLTLNVVNPGDGMLILDLLRLIQNEYEHLDLNYELRFFGEGNFDQLGIAFDELMNQTDGSRGQTVDETFLTPNSNPLLPKLTFAKHRPYELLDATLGKFVAHITLLLDHFSSSVHTTPFSASGGSTSLYGLLTEFRSVYNAEEGIVWSRSIQPNLTDGLGKNDKAQRQLFETQKQVLATVVPLIDQSSDTRVPAIQLRLGVDDLNLIQQIHSFSDWVLTVDRNLGIEYFDNPTPLSNSRASYLIDYTPEVLGDVGQRLVLTTAWFNEIETLLRRGLQAFGLQSENLRAGDLLNALRTISGRIALRVLSESSSSETLIGLGLAQMWLMRQGRFQNRIVIPALIHPELFGKAAANCIALAHLENQTLQLTLVGVHVIRSHFVGDEFGGREELRLDMEGIGEFLHDEFISGDEPRLDQPMRNKMWASVLEFYLDRAARYGFIPAADGVMTRLRKDLVLLERDELGVEIQREGLLLNLDGFSQPDEDYHGVHLQIVGREQFLPREANPTEEANKAFLDEVVTHIDLSDAQPSIVMTIEETPERIENISSPGTLEIELGSSPTSNRMIVWAPASPDKKRLTNQHILIVGKSGSGKTQTIMALVYALRQKGIASLIFDFHGEYSDAASSALRAATQAQTLDAATGIPINPLMVPLDPITHTPSNYRNVVYQVTESLADIFKLGDIQKRLLKQAVDNAYQAAGFTKTVDSWRNLAPTFSTVWYQLQGLREEDKKTVRHLIARLEPLFESNIFEAEQTTFDALLQQVTVVRLSSLANKELRTAVSRFFLQKIYERMLALGPTESQRLFCVIDEAHKLTHDPTVTDLIKEARKYGVGLILSSQETRDFDRSVFANSGTLIALQLEVEDAKIMAENLGLLHPTERNAAVEILLRQRPGQALVRNNHYLPYAQVQIKSFSSRLAE